MSLFRREQRALPTTLDPYQITARPYFPNYSGEIVTETNVFAASAVLACVTLIADSIASMPVEVTRTRAGRLEVLPTPSLLIKPNETQSMFDFIHELVATLALHGCVYVYAPRQPGELPVEMRVIHPDRVKYRTDVMTDDGTVDSYYMIGAQRYELRELRAIHWLTLAGQHRGVSPLESQRNTIGMSIAMDRFLSQFYGEGATPSSVLESDQPITREQAQVLRQTWEDSHNKRRRPAVLANGLKWRSVQASAADMQMLEHREAIVRDIARVYRIPLHMINGTGGDSQTYQNLETMGVNFLRFTLLPWMRRVEDAISELFPITQVVRFNAEEFMRTDMLTRARIQQLQISSGTLSPNEARQDNDREPYPGGDAFYVQPAVPSVGTDAEPPKP